ncbi:sigma-70 family RNA polymerase sigma factor [Flavobacteriaceae bacterium GF1]
MKLDEDVIHIRKVLSGDTNAFRYFVRTYQEMGYSIAVSILKHESDAKDVVQNAFIRAYKCLHTFKRDAKFSTWFYRIVVNEALKHLRRDKKNKEITNFKGDTAKNTVVFNEMVAHFDHNDDKAKIDRVLRLMKPKEALVLKLHYLHEAPIVEIEKITGFTKSNVKVLLHRARKSFQALFIQT